jgi:capsule polysaccharide export protein KpsC/LpsZ
MLVMVIINEQGGDFSIETTLGTSTLAPLTILHSDPNNNLVLNSTQPIKFKDVLQNQDFESNSICMMSKWKFMGTKLTSYTQISTSQHDLLVSSPKIGYFSK